MEKSYDSRSFVRLLQLAENPGFGKRPMAMSGRRGNIENFGRFTGTEAREIP